LFSTGSSIKLRFLLALLLAVVLIATDQYTDKLKPVRSALSVLVYPVRYIVDLPSQLLRDIDQQFGSYQHLLDDNKQLKQQAFINNVKLLKFAALETENIRLRSLLDSSFTLGEQFLIAELMSVNLAIYEHTVVVNKGSRFDVHDGQAVLDAHGVVGQVMNTSLLSSEIILITDPNHAIPVQVNRNGLQTVAVGTGKINQLSLPFLSNNTDIVIGDLLVTSGLGGTFPQGYPVAVIESIVKQPGKPFAVIQAKPSAFLNSSREFLIVWNNSQLISLTKEEKKSHAAE